MDATAKLHEQADRIDLWAALQSEHGFSPISIDMRSEVDRIDGYIRELRDEINWLHAELQGAEMEAKKAAELKAENRRLRSCLEDAAENDRLTTHEFNQLEEERDKLRELAEMAWKAAERLCQAFDGPCRADDVTIYKPCPMGERDEECIYGQLQGELRECGVEVDG